MPSGVSKRPREVVKSPLPALIRPQSTITRQSWKHMSYNGHLQLWDSFESDVRATFEQTPWINLTAIIEHRPAGTPGQANTVNEQISCGGEGGIEGRIQANIGHPMSAVCLAAGMGLQFGDYKATLDRRIVNEIPDIAIMSRNGEGRSLGEVKSPWPTLQPLSDAVDDDSKLRKLVAQIARYMKLAGLKYGFLSTYNETIFLKQERQNNRWILRYSRPIPWDAEFKDSELGRRPQVTLRECFWHFLNLIDHGHRARNWVS